MPGSGFHGRSWNPFLKPSETDKSAGEEEEGLHKMCWSIRGVRGDVNKLPCQPIVHSMIQRRR